MFYLLRVSVTDDEPGLIIDPNLESAEIIRRAHAMSIDFKTFDEQIASGWKWPEMPVYEENGQPDTNQFIWGLLGPLTVHENASYEMIRLLDEHCYSTWARGNHADYRVYCPRERYDAFDEDNSDFELETNDGPNHYIYRVFRCVLRQSKIGPAPIFRLHGTGHLRSRICVSQSFKDLYDELGMTHLEFFEVGIS